MTCSFLNANGFGKTRNYILPSYWTPVAVVLLRASRKFLWVNKSVLRFVTRDAGTNIPIPIGVDDYPVTQFRQTHCGFTLVAWRSFEPSGEDSELYRLQPPRVCGFSAQICNVVTHVWWRFVTPNVEANRRGTDDRAEGQNEMAACSPGSRVASG